MVNIEFLWFEDLGDGRSRLRGRSICPNTEARDALLSSGMEGGLPRATTASTHCCRRCDQSARNGETRVLP